MATNAEVLDLAMSRLGQRSSLRVRTDVLAEINATIDRLERGTFIPWFLEKTASLAFGVGDTSQPLPTDFAIEADESRPHFVLNGTVFYLTKRFAAAIQGEIPNAVRFYAISGNNFLIRKAADIAYTILVPYYGRVTGNLVDDATAVSNLWLIDAKDWVLYEALTTVAAIQIQNDKLSQKMAVLAAGAKREVYNFHEARININQDFVVGGSSDGS